MAEAMATNERNESVASKGKTRYGTNPFLKKWKELWFRLLIISLVLIIVGSTISAAVNTSGGTVTVRNIEFVTDSNVSIAGSLYVPDSATPEHPAPAVYVQHGGNCTRETMSTFSTELSRRGYVVFNAESWGNGYSEVNHNDDVVSAVYGVEYLSKLSFVDTTRIGALGHSAGCSQVVKAALYNDNEFGVRSVMVMGAGANSFTPDTPVNLCILVGYRDENHSCSQTLTTDEGNLAVFGVEDEIELGHYYGSLEDHTARVMYNPDGVFHLMMLFTPSVVSQAVDFFNTTMDYDGGIPANETVFLWKELGSAMGYVGLMMFIIAMVLGMMKLKFFAGIVGQEYKPEVPRSAKFYIGVGIVVLFSALGMQLLFYIGNNYVPKISSAFQLTIVNGAVVYTLVAGIFMIVANLIIKATTKGYNFKEESLVYKTTLVQLIKTIILAAIIFVVSFLIAAFVQWGFSGNHFRFFIRPELFVMSLERFKVFAIYFWIFLIGQLITSYVQTTSYRTIGGGNRTFLLSVLIINFLPMALYLAMIIGYKSFGLNLGSSPIHDFLRLSSPLIRYNGVIWGMLFMSPMNAVVTVVCYNKTKKIYLGTLINTILLTWIACGCVLGEAPVA